MRRVRVLNYHRICEDYDDYNFTNVTPKNFADQMEYIYKNFEVLPSEKLENDEIFDDGPDSVVLTFDDGYRDVMTNVLPILDKYSMPVTIFISTECIDLDHENWTDTIVRAIFQGGSYKDNFTLKSGVFRGIWNTDSIENRTKLYKNIRELLRIASKEERESIISELSVWGDIPQVARASRRIMTSEEIRLVDKVKGVTVGAHTVTHPFLASLDSDEIEWEMEASKRRLEEILGHQISYFAYPFGSYSDLTYRISVEKGYKMAFTSGAEGVLPDTDKMLIPRYSIRNYNRHDFISKIDEVFGAEKKNEEIEPGCYIGRLEDDYSLLNSSQKIIICGAGNIGMSLYRRVLDFVEETRVAAFIDNDVEKQGTSLFGRRVTSIDAIEDVNQYVFLVTGWYSEEKFKELRAVGCKNIHMVN